MVYSPAESSDLFFILGCMISNGFYLSFPTLHSGSLWRTDIIFFAKLNKPPSRKMSPLYLLSPLGINRGFTVFQRSPCVVSVIGPPSPPIITHIDVTHNAIKVEWNVPTTKQTTPITGYVLRIKKQGDFTSIEVTFQAKSNYYILGNLTRGSNYTVWLYATNVAGRSNASEGKQVETLINGE